MPSRKSSLTQCVNTAKLQNEHGTHHQYLVLSYQSFIITIRNLQNLEAI